MDKKEKVDEIMDTISELLIKYVKRVFTDILKKEISDKEAITMISNIGLHLMNKNKDIIINSLKN